jgi:hypothetical protein
MPEIRRNPHFPGIREGPISPIAPHKRRFSGYQRKIRWVYGFCVISHVRDTRLSLAPVEQDALRPRKAVAQGLALVVALGEASTENSIETFAEAAHLREAVPNWRDGEHFGRLNLWIHLGLDEALDELTDQG